MKERPLYLANAALASGVLYYVLDLSSPGRGVVDWTVIGLVVCAILWNLVQLGRRLHQAGGGRASWHLLRTVLFWILGLFNTVLLRPEDVGGWRSWLGWACLLLAVLDTVSLLMKERRCIGAEAQHGG